MGTVGCVVVCAEGRIGLPALGHLPGFGCLLVVALLRAEESVFVEFLNV